MDDGYRYIYIYDSRNRLVQVNRRDPSSNSADHVGSVFAKFSYNALGWRTSAVYDLHDKSISPDTQFEGTPGAGGGGRSESRGRVEDGGDGSPITLLSDTTAFETAMSAPPFDSNDPVGGSLRADVDGDGYLTKWDEEYFNAYSSIHQLAQQDAMDLFNGWNIGDVENLGTWDGRGELSRWHEVGQTSDGEISIRLKHSAWIALDNRLGYAGYVWDPHLKLYHVRHRVYDPREGTWLQEDPIGIAGGLNLHEYCNSDPINFVDPMGLEGLGTRAWGWLKAAGGAIEAGIGTAMMASGVLAPVGAVLLVHGIDTAVAGVFQAATGENTTTLTSQGVKAVSQWAGASESTAYAIGEGVDLAIGLLTLLYNPGSGAKLFAIPQIIFAEPSAARGAIAAKTFVTWVETGYTAQEVVALTALIRAASAAGEKLTSGGDGGCSREKSRREEYMGRTPGKNSRTGRETIRNAELDGKIRVRGGVKEFLASDGKWHRIEQADMSHKVDAVRWWNLNGRFLGPRNANVRAWMLDSANYYLEYGSTNRSAGARLRERYLPPFDGFD